MVLGALLGRLQEEYGGYELIAHHTQGEFHHDVILEVHDANALGASHLAVSTNCNGGIKEVLAFESAPTSEALWHARCPDEPEFRAERLPDVLGRARTEHYFDPCELLRPDARSELRPEFRKRQRGGGWCKR